MGGCESARQTEAEILLERCQGLLDMIGLNRVHWKQFVSKVALYGIVSKITKQKICAIMEEIHLLNEFNDEGSPLRQFLSLLQLDNICNARDLMYIGLLMCKGSDREKGEYFSSLIEADADYMSVIDIMKPVKYLMSVAAQTIPELSLRFNNRDNKLAERLIHLHQGIFAAAVKRWVPLGRSKGGMIVMNREMLVDWVAQGELQPMRALNVAITVYQSMKDIAIINFDENYNGSNGIINN
eukprot:TRINITY_DN14533_c0_g1_i11.p1 TRINITY_DN14533_c0_g1~~TRINITY_DN14533_c0_g1_i11.p1  ORF type:complete len:240 (+),score=51.39 TRINITY_DN14533_c0_g1_i11:62-781(+)